MSWPLTSLLSPVRDAEPAFLAASLSDGFRKSRAQSAKTRFDFLLEHELLESRSTLFRIML
jgi:hypothetical protein